ncbi:MAG: DUF4139 domain-containing protein [Anaerolineae bacterium]|nr:DUF4139 domain-containing protein [Anaerolineae bacterium]
MFEKRASSWSLAVLLAVACVVLSGIEQGSAAAVAQAEGVELAVYNQNLALVKEHRSLDLTKGLNEVRFADVAAMIDPTSVHFSSLTDPQGTVVLEQNYEYDVVGSAKLLQKYVDQEISLVTEDGQKYTGTLLNATEDAILQSADGKVTVVKVNQIKEFDFPALPEGLITKPTLVWQVESAQGEAQDVEVTYLTGGINWYANYVAVLADDDASLDLNGWITLDNRSGASYKDAKLKVIAGDIHRAATDGYAEMAKVAYDAMTAPAAQVEERSFFEYHLYEVQRPVTVKDQQTKQIEFVTGSGIPALKFFVYDGSQIGYWGRYEPVQDPGYGTTSNEKVQVMLEFRNGEKEGLGVPLPKGTIRVFKEDIDGSTLLIGEDSIDHTPKDEQIRLYIGDAFDIVGERAQTDFRIDTGRRFMEESYRITLRNHKDEKVEVRVTEHMFRWSQWEILEESLKHEKLDAQTIEFRVPVEADGEVVVTYTVRYEW